ncbi:MAG: glycosyltransferase [Burkholderiaceae bacterium]|nr:MAG: glycosyltransferase [Burkholderiaceae bacterium]
MRVCFVNLGALAALSRDHKHQRIGGEEVQHAQLSVALARRGHDVSLVVADGGQEDGAEFEGVKTFKAFREADGLPGLRFIYPRWIKLWSAIARADADVYYFSCASMTLGLLAMFCRLHKRRLVFRTAIDTDCARDGLLIRYARDRWLYQFGLKRADAILVQSVTQQRALLANYGRQSTLAGMLVARPTAVAGRVPKDIDVLWVSNIRHIKRPDRILEIARALPNVRFHMAGGPSPGEEDLYREIQREARGIENLTFHGGVPYLDIGDLFDRARVFANTSDLEGFPNTFLQAWIRGIPVVTMFDPDGLVGRCGLGSSHTSVSDMTHGLSTMLGSVSVHQAASDAALAYIEQHYGEEKVLGPYLAALEGRGVEYTTNSPASGRALAASERDGLGR